MSRKRESCSKNEELEDEDFSSEDIQVYCPEVEDTNLEVDEEAYCLLEYINLEWPAQSIGIRKDHLYLGTNPDTSNGIRNNKELIEIRLKNMDFTHLKHYERVVGQFINKIAVLDKIYAISDDLVCVYGMDLRLIHKAKDVFSYGLHVTDKNVLAGTVNGELLIYDLKLNLVNRFKIHKGEINAIVAEDDLIYTAGSDNFVRIVDFMGSVRRELENDSEVNAMDIKNGKLIYGDENGLLHLYDAKLDTNEAINWHKTPISVVRWRNEEMFASGSDEQVCIWDITLSDDWEFSKYLLFVHQGQEYYKDIGFYEDKVITTALDGLCIFTPISFIPEKEDTEQLPL